MDEYADCLVTQFQSAGVEAHRELIADLLMEITGAKTIFDRSDAATRQREGLPIRSELLRGEEPPAAIEVVEDGVRYGVDVRVGHKTGFYVDQRESRLTAQKVAEEFRRVHGRGMRALNCFCYTGGFSLALLKGGAAEVVSVDSSQEALDMGLVNKVVPLAELENEYVAWAEEMMQLSPLALRMIKVGLNAELDGQAGIQELAGDATMLYYMTDEAQEGGRAFLEKRKPKWNF